MALRVLLADESTTIKRVFQLALQDYAVEVQSVNVGVDVCAVAENFKPDIIFADVLLQKKNGYDACLELKGHAELRSIPVVLMWSGFMELDEDKFQACEANSHLEKPFDVDQLRKLIQAFVPKTKEQKLSEYMKFPTTPNLQAEFGSASGKHVSPMPAGQNGLDMVQAFSSPNADSTQPGEPTAKDYDQSLNMPVSEVTASENDISTGWSMDQFAPIEDYQSTQQEDFSAVSLPAEPPRGDASTSSHLDSKLIDEDVEDEAENPWVAQPLTKFEMPDNDDDIELEIPYDESQVNEPIDSDDLLKRFNSRTNTKSARSDNSLSTEDQNRRDHLVDTGDVDTYQQETIEQNVSHKIAQELTAKNHSQEGLPVMNLTEKQLESIIRAQSLDVIEAVVWKVVPELAKQMIEREIKRLLNEQEL